MGRFAATVGAIAVALVALPTALARGDDQAFPPVARNPADRLLNMPIDDFAYDFARKCTRYPKRGTLALEAWLGRRFTGVSWGIMRCEKLGRRHYSLHADGRALDWHLDVHNPRDRAAAWRLINTLLAPDRLGNQQALARRMGLQELIWDCRAWWAGSPVLVDYGPCYDRRNRLRRRLNETVAHRDHIHIGLNRAGAAMHTSFWAAR